MIAQLSSPAVVVIDDERADYEPILTALNGLYVSCVHLLGEIDKLPAHPFRGLRLVFVDLHLSGTVGRNAASYTANFFRRVVSPETAPVVVVIWSKYANDNVAGAPAEDQETEADLFKRTLLESDPRYNERLIFVELAKPMQGDRPADWTEILKTEIERAFQNQSAVSLLWSWDSIVKDACTAVNANLTSVASGLPGAELRNNLQSMMQRLARAHAGSNLSPATAPRHLIAVLASLLADQIEHAETNEILLQHGNWLSANPAAAPAGFSARINGVLLSGNASAEGIPYAPGTVYRLNEFEAFTSAFGRDCPSLIETLCSLGANSPQRAAWRTAVKPVVVEVSPACDVAQNHRASSLLIAGLIVPIGQKANIKRGDAFTDLPPIRIRWAIDGFPEQDAILAFCHRYKAALPSAELPNWLIPWFRLRELPTASLRNAQAGHSSRVGFVSLPEQ